MKPKVLTVGSDEMLVYTRCRILSGRYEAATCPPEKVDERLRNEHFDLLLVCNSFPVKDGIHLIEDVQKRFPSLRTVRIISALWPNIPEPIATREVLTDFRPEVWIRAVDEALNCAA